MFMLKRCSARRFLCIRCVCPRRALQFRLPTGVWPSKQGARNHTQAKPNLTARTADAREFKKGVSVEERRCAWREGGKELRARRAAARLIGRNSRQHGRSIRCAAGARLASLWSPSDSLTALERRADVQLPAFVDSISSLAFHPTNPNLLLVSSWDRVRSSPTTFPSSRCPATLGELTRECIPVGTPS